MNNLRIVACLWIAIFGILQAPSNKGTTKNHSAGSTGQTAATAKTQRNSAAAPDQIVVLSQKIEPPIDKAKTGTSDDTEIQRQLAKYTDHLVWVGIGQTVVLALTLVVIGLQAKLMKTHADHLKSLAGAAESNTIAAAGQLKTMGDQLTEMSVQSGILKESVGIARDAAKAAQDGANAAKESAEATRDSVDTFISKERAKLRIELEPFQPVRSDGVVDSYVISGAVSIYGSTEAFIEKTEIYASIGEEGIDHPLPEWLFGMHLPPVIRAGAPAVKISALVNGKDGPASDEEITPVREAKAFVYCIAKIEFSTLGQKWEVRFRQYFKPIWGINDTGAEFLGHWEPDGMATENGEYRQ